MIKTRTKKFLKYIMSPLLVLLVMVQATVFVYATSSTEYMAVEIVAPYYKDGKLWMPRDLRRTTLSSSTIAFSAKLVNASGKVVGTWKEQEVTSQWTRRNYNISTAGLASGTYTFHLIGKVTYNAYSDTNHPSWVWKQAINHKSSGSLTLKGYEKQLNDSGKEVHTFTVGYTGGVGKSVVMRIFDSQGNLVTLIQGNQIKAESGNRIFKWDGYSDIGSGYKCKPGKYTVQVYYSGHKEVVEKTYDLKIH